MKTLTSLHQSHKRLVKTNKWFWFVVFMTLFVVFMTLYCCFFSYETYQNYDWLIYTCKSYPHECTSLWAELLLLRSEGRNVSCTSSASVYHFHTRKISFLVGGWQFLYLAGSGDIHVKTAVVEGLKALGWGHAPSSYVVYLLITGIHCYCVLFFDLIIL